MGPMGRYLLRMIRYSAEWIISVTMDVIVLDVLIIYLSIVSPSMMNSTILTAYNVTYGTAYNTTYDVS